MNSRAGMLEGMAIAITGAARGIGQGIAMVASREGAAVALCDVDGEAAARAAGIVTAQGGRAIAVQMDVTQRAGIANMLQSTVDAFGALDGLVCAGMRRVYAPAERFPDADWDMVVAQGLTAYFRCAQEAARHMLARDRQGGAIVFISSTANRHAVAGGAAYCSVKSGVQGLARQLGVEWAGRGIRTNAIAPGLTLTDGARQAIGIEEAAARTPMRRAATPEDIGEVCAFLLSDRARYITAQEIVVDGGMSSEVAAVHGGGANPVPHPD